MLREDRGSREATIALNRSDLEALNRWKASAVRHGGYTEVRRSSSEGQQPAAAAVVRGSSSLLLQAAPEA